MDYIAVWKTALQLLLLLHHATWRLSTSVCLPLFPPVQQPGPGFYGLLH